MFGSTRERMQQRKLTHEASMAEAERMGSMARIEKEAKLKRQTRPVAKPPTVTAPKGMAAVTTPYLPESMERGAMGDIVKAGPKELGAIYERMPEAERPVHIIRGEKESYFSPGTRQEYGDLRTAMTGFQQRPKAEKSSAIGMKELTGLRESAFKNAQEQMEATRDLVTGQIINPATGGPMTEKVYNNKLNSLALDYYTYATGGGEQAGGGMPAAGGGMPAAGGGQGIEKGMTALSGAGTEGFAVPDVPQAPKFESEFFPDSRESLYDTGATSRNVFRKGAKGLGGYAATATKEALEVYKKWLKRPHGTDLGRMGQIYGNR